MFIWMQKIDFTTHLFKILQRKRKLVVLGNLGMPGQTHLEWYYQHEETFAVYLLVKNQLHPSCFTAKILQRYYKLVIMGTLGMSD